MKAVIALCLLCILQVSTAEEEQNLSGGAAGDPALAVLDREVREAGRNGGDQRKNGKCKCKNGCKKNGMCKKRRNKGRGQSNKGRGTKNRPASKKKPSGKVYPSKNGGERNTCLLKDSVTTIRKFSKAESELRSLRRIFNFRSQMAGKKNNANGTFADSLAAIKESMGGGKSCEGASSAADTTSAQEVYDKLANCSTTAAAMCDETAAGAAVNESALIPCNTTLPKFVSDFKKCFTTSATTVCACVAALTVPADDCLNFQTSAKKMKAQKRKCTMGGEKGSFGDCRKQERLAAKYGNMCKKSCSSGMTTSAPSKRVNYLRQLNQKMLQKVNLN